MTKCFPLHVTELLHAPEKAIEAGRVESLRRPLEHADSINLLRRLRVGGERRAKDASTQLNDERSPIPSFDHLIRSQEH